MTPATALLFGVAASRKSAGCVGSISTTSPDSTLSLTSINSATSAPLACVPPLKKPRPALSTRKTVSYGCGLSPTPGGNRRGLWPTSKLPLLVAVLMKMA
jgi:hypothetical protein